VRRRHQINSQLDPRVLYPGLRMGLGVPTGLPDFASLIAQEPSAATAWTQVQNQINVENAGNPANAQALLGTASQQFYTTWTQLSQNYPASSISDLQTISDAAGALMMNTSTIAGAVQNVQGLIQGAQSGNVPEIVQSVTGTIVSGIGLEVAAGAISFGAGAAIVAGLELADAAFQALFGQSQPAATICGNNLSAAPTFAVNCTWTFGQIIKGGPGTSGKTNPYWRRFPEAFNKNDLWWYGNRTNGVYTPVNSSEAAQAGLIGYPSSTTWTSGLSSDTWSMSLADITNNYRPIDAAFPQFHQFECDLAAVNPAASLPDLGGTFTGTVLGLSVSTVYSQSQVAFAKFVQAFYAAWKANAEYAINGLAPQSDAAVLAQTIKFWNDAHPSAGAADYAINPKNTAQDAYQTDVASPGTSCSGDLGSHYYYLQMLLPELLANNYPTVPFNASGGIVIHAGAIGSQIGNKILPITVAPPVAAGSDGSALKGVAYGAAAVAAASLLGTAVYARATKKSYGSVWKGIWGKTGGRVHLPKSGGRR
jgi:hypothetical protein